VIKIVSATARHSAQFEFTPLGASLARLRWDKRLSEQITFENKRSLASVYNGQIAQASDEDILVFIHDDVWIDDQFVADRVTDALQEFDIIGVAGNRRVTQQHVNWFFKNDKFQKDDDEFLSGAVAHSARPCGPISWYGPSPADCELLDGVLIAAKRSTLRNADMKFDEKFAFHFYDLDFSRAARKRGLHVGTWPIGITHASGGAFDTKEWRDALKIYREIWC
jgi:GT2 family glycosyltransferase